MTVDAAVLAAQNRGPTVLTVTIILLSISTAFTALRLISRFGVVKRISNDDYMIILAWLINFGFSFAICYGTSVGLGRHEDGVPLEHRTPLRKAEYVFTVLYNPGLMATKNSIALFYLTLSQNQQIFRWTTIATMVVVNVAGVGLTFLNIFQCRPVGAAFDDPINPSAHCIDVVTLFLSSAPVNIVTDLALLFLPMPILTGMKLPRNEKIILVATFSFGAFVAVVDVVRIAYLESAAVSRLEVNGSSPENTDYSWVASLSFMWSAVEVNVGIICACVPGVKPLAARFFPRLLGRIKKAGEMRGSTFYGPGDAQWAGFGPKTLSSTNSGPRSPTPAAADAVMASPLPAPINGPNGGVRFADEKQNGDSGQEMGMMDFLTTPDSKWPPNQVQRTQTTATASTKSTAKRPGRARSASLTVFEFVNMRNPSSMTNLTNKESIFPNALVTILFFLWGFAYGLLDILNQQFQKVTHITDTQITGLHSAYYGAYFVAPLTFGYPIFRKGGFKSMFISGLCIYGFGTLVFWPSAVLASYPAFLISNLLIGLGVATLETAGNPFITLCGPPAWAEVRLNISQGVQAIGTVVSPILARKVFFKNVNDAPSLIDVQWAYLGIALFVIILALVFYYLPIPEASDEELEHLAEKRETINSRRIVGIPVVYVTLAMGVFSQFCYVGGQEAAANYFEKYITVVQPNSATSPFNLHAVGHTVFAIGRFLSAVGGIYIKPRRILLLLFVGCIIAASLATHFSGATGTAMITLVLFFESGIFSLIYAISLRGLGSRTKLGAVLLTAGTSGGALVPAVFSPVSRSRGVQYAWVVVVASFTFGITFPTYLAIVPAAKRQVDPGRMGARKVRSQDELTQQTSNRASRVFHNVMHRVKRNDSDTTVSTGRPSIEHVEGATAAATATQTSQKGRYQSGNGMDLAPWPG